MTLIPRIDSECEYSLKRAYNPDAGKSFACTETSVLMGVIGDPRTSLDPMISIAYDSHFVHALL